MPSPYVIEGMAIVSADGMLADADGVMPPALFIEGDQAFFEQSLDAAAAVIHGRHSGEQQPKSGARLRLIATHSVKTLTPDPSNPKALLWNPATTPFEDGLRALGVTRGPDRHHRRHQHFRAVPAALRRLPPVAREQSPPARRTAGLSAGA